MLILFILQKIVFGINFFYKLSLISLIFEMIISDTQRFIFLHIPKCGGTTIRNSLKNFDTRNNYFWMFLFLEGATEKSPKQQIDKAHMSLPIFKRLYPNDYELLNDYTVFAFSRNPIKRLISSFWEPRKKIFKTFYDNQSDINEKNKIQELFNNYLEKLVFNYAFLDHSFLHATPQSMYVTEGKKVVTDVIIKLDDPTDGINSLSVLIPEVAKTVSTAIKSSKLNASTQIKKDFLWEEAPSRLKENYLIHYKNDFDLLGYKKPLV